MARCQCMKKKRKNKRKLLQKSPYWSIITIEAMNVLAEPKSRYI